MLRLDVVVAEDGGVRESLAVKQPSELVPVRRGIVVDVLRMELVTGEHRQIYFGLESEQIANCFEGLSVCICSRGEIAHVHVGDLQNVEAAVVAQAKCRLCADDAVRRERSDRRSLHRSGGRSQDGAPNQEH